MTDYLVRFVATLDPNGNTGINWPKYTASSKQLLVFRDGLVSPLTIGADDYRASAMQTLTQITLSNPI